MTTLDRIEEGTFIRTPLRDTSEQRREIPYRSFLYVFLCFFFFFFFYGSLDEEGISFPALLIIPFLSPHDSSRQ